MRILKTDYRNKKCKSQSGLHFFETNLSTNKLINTPENIFGQTVYNGRYVVSGFGLIP